MFGSDVIRLIILLSTIDLSVVHLQIVLESIGFSIWQVAVAPHNNSLSDHNSHIGNGYLNDRSNDSDDPETSESDTDELHVQSPVEDMQMAIACDDGCVRIYRISDSDDLVYHKSMPRVSGKILHLIDHLF